MNSKQTLPPFAVYEEYVLFRRTSAWAQKVTIPIWESISFVPEGKQFPFLIIDRSQVVSWKISWLSK